MIGRPILPPLGSIAALGLAGVVVWYAMTADAPILEGLAIAPKADVRGEKVSEVPGEDNDPQALRLAPAVLARPIFAETRRPAVRKVVPKAAPPAPKKLVRAAAAKPKAPPAPPRLEFRGTMTSDAGRLALIVAGSGAGDWHGTGTRFGPWELSEIGRHHIVLRHGSFTHRVELYRQ